MYVGNIALVKRKRVVDESGIHYPIKRITVMSSTFTSKDCFVVPVDKDMADTLKGHGLRKGMPIAISGEIKPVKDKYGTLFFILKPTQIELVCNKKQKGTKAWKSRL